MDRLEKNFVQDEESRASTEACSILRLLLDEDGTSNSMLDSESDESTEITINGIPIDLTKQGFESMDVTELLTCLEGPDQETQELLGEDDYTSNASLSISQMQPESVSTQTSHCNSSSDNAVQNEMENGGSLTILRNTQNHQNDESNTDKSQLIPRTSSEDPYSISDSHRGYKTEDMRNNHRLKLITENDVKSCPKITGDDVTYVEQVKDKTDEDNSRSTKQRCEEGHDDYQLNGSSIEVGNDNCHEVDDCSSTASKSHHTISTQELYRMSQQGQQNSDKGDLADGVSTVSGSNQHTAYDANDIDGTGLQSNNEEVLLTNQGNPDASERNRGVNSVVLTKHTLTDGESPGHTPRLMNGNAHMLVSQLENISHSTSEIQAQTDDENTTGTSSPHGRYRKQNLNKLKSTLLTEVKQFIDRRLEALVISTGSSRKQKWGHPAQNKEDTDEDTEQRSVMDASTSRESTVMMSSSGKRKLRSSGHQAKKRKDN